MEAWVDDLRDEIRTLRRLTVELTAAGDRVVAAAEGPASVAELAGEDLTQFLVAVTEWWACARVVA